MKEVLLALALVPGLASAQDATEGAEIFRLYCTGCHGLTAEGNGSVASILTIQPTDLTVLAAENGGEFPISRVIARIDGRDPLVAHGSPMPVFGEWFEGRGETIRSETGERIMTSQPIIDLLTYLQQLQRKSL